MDLRDIIPLMLAWPLFGGLVCPLLPSRRPGVVKLLALVWSGMALLFSLALAYRFDWSHPGEAVTRTVPWIEGFGLQFGFGVDAVSLWLILLTTCLMPIAILGSFTAGDLVNKRAKEFFGWLLLLEAAMLGVFVATDVVFFYVCFEFTLIPMYFLIGIFGSTQRLRAARIFFLYTFTGSMLTFAGIVYVAWFNTTLPASLFQHAGEWSFDIQTLCMAAHQMTADQQCWVFAALLAGFAVKVPVFPFHTWLPLAHTEAPTAGSVVLAGVLLKLGTYAILRLALPMAPEAAVAWAPMMGCLAVAGIIYTALICWVQKDIKKLIAYSSVSHLGFCVLGLFALQQDDVTGQAGAVMYMINHGISTGALFLCIGMIYERFHTREMSQYSGLAKAMPIWACFMIFFCFASLGLPGLNGFVGEFLTLLAAFNAEQTLGWKFALLGGTGMVLGAIYILYMVGKVIWGPVKLPHGAKEAKDLNFREITVLTPLAVACLVLGLFPTPVLRSLDAPLTKIIAPVHSVLEAKASSRPEPPKAPTHSVKGHARQGSNLEQVAHSSSSNGGQP